MEASRTTIGDGFDGNVIAGTTTGAGIELDGDRNTVKANKVGTDSAGAVALPNLGGIRVSGSRNVIGGTGFLADNLISGNAFYGIELVAPGYANEVEGNLIGLEAFGVDPLPNGGPGIRISGSDGNVIGGLAARQANSIAFNAGDGVHVESGAGNAISGNAIGGNGGLAIDLDLDGPAPNDAPGSGDADTGANGLQNHPLVTAAETVAVFGGVRTDVQWELDSAPSTSYRIELYANATCDASGSGEASTLIGTLAVATDATGHAAGVVTADVVVQPGDVVAATATATTGLAPGGTSELSPCRVVT